MHENFTRSPREETTTLKHHREEDTRSDKSNKEKLVWSEVHPLSAAFMVTQPEMWNSALRNSGQT